MKKIFSFLRKNILEIIFGLFFFFLIIFARSNLYAVREGIALWGASVIPSLFPFFIATELLNYTSIPHLLGKVFSPIMKTVFRLPGESAYAFIMGIVSGYPIGAKIVSDFYQGGVFSKEEAERCLAFTNNSGPLFIIGSVGILFFGNSLIGILLLVTHILASVTVGVIFGRVHSLGGSRLCASKNVVQTRDVEIKNLSNIITESVRKSIGNVLMVGGFLVLFSIILSIVERARIVFVFQKVIANLGVSEDFVRGVMYGIIELTNGVKILSTLNTKSLVLQICSCAFLLGVGGISVLLQVSGIVVKYNLKLRWYIKGKLLQGIIATLYTLILLYIVPILNFNIPS